MYGKKEYLLVDGYNIIHAWDSLKVIADNSLADARDKLIAIMSDYQGYKHINVIVVFDAHLVKGGITSIESHAGITVVYTKEAETADAYIERTTNDLSRQYKVWVATSDMLEQIIIIGRGANRLSARDLEEQVAAAKKEMQAKYIENRPIKSNLLFDNLDKKTAEILEQMRLNKG